MKSKTYREFYTEAKKSGMTTIQIWVLSARLLYSCIRLRLNVSELRGVFLALTQMVKKVNI